MRDVDDIVAEWARELAAQTGMSPAEVSEVLGGVTNAIEPRALYLDDAELAKLLLGKSGPNERRVIEAFALEGLPAKDPLTGLRFWPAVVRWLDQRHGLADGPAPVVDGEERF